MGQTYVDVAAAQADMGIMTMAASSGGQDTGGAWLYWTDNGFTGQGWYWEDSNNYVKTGWETAVINDGGYVNDCKGNADGTAHTGSYEDFLYHVSQRHTENLDYILGGWDTKMKVSFCLQHSDLETAGCIVWDQ